MGDKAIWGKFDSITSLLMWKNIPHILHRVAPLFRASHGPRCLNKTIR